VETLAGAFRLRLRGLATVGVPVILAAFLVLPGLSEQGVFNFDEVRCLVESRELGGLIRRAWNPDFPPASAPSFVIGEMSKPAMLVFCAALGSSDTACLFAQAVLGFGCVTLTWLLAFELFGRSENRFGGGLAASLAAVFLAASPAHVFFSRTVLPDIEALFFLLASVYGRTRATNRPFLLGLVDGTGFLFHPRFVYFLPVLYVLEFQRPGAIRRIGWNLAGFVLPLLATECASRWLRAAILARGEPWTFGTYIDRMRYYLSLAQGTFRLSWPSFSLEYVGVVEGWAFLILAGTGLVAVWKRRHATPHGILFSVFPLYFLAFGSLYELDWIPDARFGRTLFPAMPFLAVLAAAGFLTIAESGKRARVVAILFLGLTLIQRAATLNDLRSLHADYRVTIPEIAARYPSRLYLSDQPYHVMHQLGSERYAAFASPRSETVTVLIFDPARRGRMRWSVLLADTPVAAVFRPGHRPSKLHEFEENTFTSGFVLPEPEISPVDIYILEPNAAGRSAPIIPWM
jgi:4-amino-4-deoxy-L-arabinose transferase-like glycosyltransferase